MAGHRPVGSNRSRRDRRKRKSKNKDPTTSGTPSASGSGKSLAKPFLIATFILFLILFICSGVAGILISFIPVVDAMDVLSEEIVDPDLIVTEGELDGTMDSFTADGRPLGWRPVHKVATHLPIEANDYGWFLAFWNAGIGRRSRELVTECVPGVMYEPFDRFGKSWRHRYRLNDKDTVLRIWHRDLEGQKIYDKRDFTLSWAFREDDETGRAPRQQTYETVVILNKGEEYRLIWSPVLPGLIGGNEMHYRGRLDILGPIDQDTRRLLKEPSPPVNRIHVTHATHLRNFPLRWIKTMGAEKKIQMLVFNEGNHTGIADYEDVFEVNQTIHMTSRALRRKDTLHINGNYRLVFLVRYDCTLHFTLQVHWDEL